MSLFTLTEWFFNDIPRATCISVGNLVGQREQLIVGGEDGLLTVLDPGISDRVEDTLLLQQETKTPVISILIGDYLSLPGATIVVLSPNRLSFYRLNYDADDLSKTALEEVSTHEMQEGAFNMCSVPNVPTNQILVQSVGCGLTLFQGDQCMFTRTPLPSLNPGPIAYSNMTSSLILASGAKLHSVKFSLLYTLGSSGKKVTYDWSFNLGDAVIDMCMEDGPPIQPSIVVLCRRNIFCLTTGGIVRWQIRLECIATSFLVYKTGASSPTIRTCVATNTNTLLIYSDNALLWNCQTSFSAISLQMGTFSATYQYVLALLSPNGRVVIGYLGTEPNLYKIAMENRAIDFSSKVEELRSMEASIKDTSGSAPDAASSFTITCDVEDSSGERDLVHGESPSCLVKIKYMGHSGEKVVLNVRSQVSFQFVDRSADGAVLKFSPSAKVSTTAVDIVAHCSMSQATSTATFSLPLWVMFHECSPDRNAKSKLVVDTDRNVLPLHELFPEFKTENPSSIGLQLYRSDNSVSIFTATKTNRYRVQTDNASLLFVVVNELIERLKVKENGIIINSHIPFDLVGVKLDEHLELESRLVSIRSDMEKSSMEVRAIQALLLNKSKNTKPEPLENIDYLFKTALKSLLTRMDTLAEANRTLGESGRELCSLFSLVELLLRVGGTDTTLNCYFFSDTQQSLRERLSWASGLTAEPSQMLAALCKHVSKALTHIAEEMEENEFEEDLKIS